MLEGQNQVSGTDIAIVGMALRVPGARNVGEFWQNLRDGVESIRTYSQEELLAAGETAERIHQPNYVPRGADLPDMDMFDAEFFGLSPKEAAIMDPQHRQFLECAWEAMEDAGKCSATGTGRVGVFAGCGMGSYFYFNVCSNRHLVEQVGMFLLRHTGNDKDFLATRASFTFNLQGPSVNVQTACSTSLVAVHYAAQSLLNGECDMALAGGVTIEFPHRRGYLCQEGEILSPDGHCRAFDHRAAGTVFGSGVGVVVLRRLSDALSDGDVIHAVIKGTAINNDGSTKAGYLAPSVTGQAEAIVEAHALAGVSADSIGYVECHGTGTRLGDPIEVAALTQAFRHSTSRTGFCYIGSVKTNIGHLDTAAGVAALIKTALILRHGEIPPSLGFERPNPAIAFEDSPFMVSNKLVSWPQASGPRRAAVNSLGVGGTNAHAVLEQAPQRYLPEAMQTAAGEHETDPLILLLSARQRASLDRAAANLASAISARPDTSMADIAYTLQKGRRHFEHRMVLAVRGQEDALEALSKPLGRAFIHSPVGALSGAVFLFPGGGAQYPGMAASLYRQEERFRAKVEEGLSYLDEEVASEIRSLWFGLRSEEAQQAFLSPSMQLPAILICEIALAQLWLDWGVRPVALIGHSMGENAAACLAGVLTFRDAVRLVHLRGQLFETVEPGGMLSVPLDPDRLAELLPASLDLASVNAPNLCVVSGRNEDLDDFQSLLMDMGVDASRVAIHIAAHSRLVEPVLARFDAFLRSLDLQRPSIPIISNRTGLPLRAEEAMDPGYWCAHLRSTVRFADGMAHLCEEPGRVYIEIGPGRILSSLAKAQGTIPANQILNSLPHPDEATDDAVYFHTALGRAWALGLPVDLDRQWEKRAARLTSLPAYPFHHKPYFIEAASETAQAGKKRQSLATEADLSRWGYRPSWKRSLVDDEEDPRHPALKWLVFLDDGGVGLALAERLRGQGETAVTVSLGDAFVQRAHDDYVLCAEHGRVGYEALVAALLAAGLMPDRIVHMWLLTSAEVYRPGSNFFHRNQECGFHSLFHLMQALGEAPLSPTLHLTVVTNGMQQVASEPLPYPEKATILGPALVLPQEIPGLTSTIIDVDLQHESPSPSGRFSWLGLFSVPEPKQSPSSSKLLDQLWAELMAPPKNQMLALRDGVRWSQHRRRMPLPEAPVDPSILRQAGVYFMTGGLGDIGFTIAMGLAQRFHAKLILFGRTVLPPRREWDRYCLFHGHDPIRRAMAAIESLEEAGAEVLYVSGNVANPEDVAMAVQAGLHRFGAIHGVFHAAGFVEDGLIQAKTASSIEKVMTAKVLGTAVLDSALRDIPLDLFVLFSSTSTDVVRPGQADYLAANAYLNAYAQSRVGGTGRRTVALHWGIWKDVGLAARALDARLVPAGWRSISGPAQGPVFGRWVEDETGIPWLEAEFSDRNGWMLNEHRLLSGEAVLPGTAYLELLVQAAKEYGLPLQFEVDNLVFLKPFVVEDLQQARIRVRLEEQQDGYKVHIVNGETGGDSIPTRHAEAFLRVSPEGLPTAAAAPASLSQVRTAPRPADSPALRSVQAHSIRFGERWQVLQSLTMGEGEAVAELRLAEAYHQDLAGGVLLHPALLDIATGCALALARDYDPDGGLWVPATYTHIAILAALPAEIVSWVRLAGDAGYGRGYASFDITIFDRHQAAILDIKGFVMHHLQGTLAPEAVTKIEPAHSSAAKGTPDGSAMSRLAEQVRNGIPSDKGFDLLMRALATHEAQPIVSSIDLDMLEEWVEAGKHVAAPASASFERPQLDNDYLAPRNEVEERLAQIWQDLLGVARIGVTDSFFDMGGHSLVAVRMFRTIKQEFGLDLPISFLLESPTIALCAEKILAQQPQGNGSRRDSVASVLRDVSQRIHLVLMDAGQVPDATPLFICAGMFGNILNLRHLAREVGADRPVYGLQARGLYGDHQPHTSFAEMARDYLAEIRQVQPQGPYLLAGYSGGGITAYEMAQQLLAQGEEVAQLVMLDTPLPRQPSLSLGDRLLMKLQDLRRHKDAFLREWLTEKKRWKAEISAKRKSLEQPVHSQNEFNNHAIEAAFRQAAQDYEVHSFRGQVTLLRPKPEVYYRVTRERVLQKNRNVILSDNGWQDYVADLLVLEVPGDHDSMVLDPYAKVIGRYIRLALSEAEHRRRPVSPSEAPADQEPRRQAERQAETA